MRTASTALLGATLAGLAALAGACGDTLVDHHAGASLLDPGCPPGAPICGGACVQEDAAHCGPGCADCAAGFSVPDAAPACVAHACAIACAPGWLRSGAGCERAAAISAGFAHTCAITAATGRVKCWGANEHGQLGDGTTRDSAVPVDVPLSGATAIAAGYAHTCAAAGGGVRCWGDNTTGALGDGTTVGRASPVPVPGLAGVVALAAGGGANSGTAPTYYGHTCALDDAGGVRCWGGNESGQLGNGAAMLPAPPQPSPVRVVGLPSAAAIAVGDRHTCAVAGGGVLCWGADFAGQLGDGATVNRATPAAVHGLGAGAGALAVAAGAAHACAIAGAAGSETLACWGSNSDGQVNAGDNATAEFLTPIAPPLGGGFHPLAVTAGAAHTCCLEPGAPDGARCFGANGSSQLSGPASARGAVDVALAPARALAAGGAHGCALLSDGGVSCWGANDRGQLGTGQAGAALGSPAYVSGL